MPSQNTIVRPCGSIEDRDRSRRSDKATLAVGSHGDESDDALNDVLFYLPSKFVRWDAVEEVDGDDVWVRPVLLRVAVQKGDHAPKRKLFE